MLPNLQFDVVFQLVFIRGAFPQAAFTQLVFIMEVVYQVDVTQVDFIQEVSILEDALQLVISRMSFTLVA